MRREVCGICRRDVPKRELPELYGGPGLETVAGAKQLALNLFTQIMKHHGEQTARRIFSLWAKSPTPRRIARINNLMLLEKLDMMEPKPNVKKLARDLAKANKKLPRTEQRGARGTNAENLERLIWDLVAEREAGMKANTWWGPFPP